MINNLIKLIEIKANYLQRLAAEAYAGSILCLEQKSVDIVVHRALLKKDSFLKPIKPVFGKNKLEAINKVQRPFRSINKDEFAKDLKDRAEKYFNNGLPEIDAHKKECLDMIGQTAMCISYILLGYIAELRSDKNSFQGIFNSVTIIDLDVFKLERIYGYASGYWLSMSTRKFARDNGRAAAGATSLKIVQDIRKDIHSKIDQLSLWKQADKIWEYWNDHKGKFPKSPLGRPRIYEILKHKLSLKNP